MTQRWRDALRSQLLVLGVWTAYGLFSIYQSHLYWRYVAERPRAWGVMARNALSSTTIWAAFTPAIVWLSRRFRFTRETWMVSLPAHFVFCLIFNTLDVAIDRMLMPFIVSPPWKLNFYQTWMVQFDTNSFSYLAIVAITHAVDYGRWYRERRRRAADLELEAARLESRLGQAHLEVLKMQLQPHFLFNTLHAISELVHEDPATADRMVTRLGDLLRMSLDVTGLQEVPLRQELAFVDAYLDIQKCRHSDRLSVETAIGAGALEASVPHLLLQPLVENAIRHGVDSRLSGCHLRIAAARHNGALEIDVEDDGPGLPVPSERREGVGLQNTRARLRGLYGDAHVMELTNRPGGGTAVHLRIPYRAAAVDADRPAGE